MAVGAGVDVGDLGRQVGFFLRLAQVAVFKDLLAALESFGLRLTDYSVLLVIEANPGLKQQSIGEALRIQRPNLVAIIDALERRGLVRRDAAPGDRRSHALGITPAGVALLERANAAQAAHEARVRAALGPSDREALLEALARLAEFGGSAS